jgi:transcriptional regulator with XRE-family HTH domain
MTTRKVNLKDYSPVRRRIDLSTGDSVRIMRELNEFTQTQLAEKTGIPLGTLTAIENDQLALEAGHATILATALHVDPCILLSTDTKSAV